jgi:type II secretory pathway component GspD/PulD (secretin)
MNFRVPLYSTVLALLLGLANSAHAQTATRAGTSSGRSNQRTGGIGGGSTNRGVGGSSSAGSGPRQYRSNTLLGDAIIQIDPESRSLVIITDEETHSEVEKVIRSLDQPRPQVLIKVVFVEVTWDKSLDAGLEGSYTFNFGNNVPGTGTRTTATTQTAPNSAGGTTTTTTNLTQTLSKLTNGNGATAGTLFGLSGPRRCTRLPPRAKSKCSRARPSSPATIRRR